MEDLQTPSPAKAALTPGVVGGILVMALYFVFYALDPIHLVKPYRGLLTFALAVTPLLVYGFKWRKEEMGGFATYGQSLQFAFVSLAVTSLFGTLAQMLIFNVIDPKSAEFVAQKTLETMVDALESFGRAGDMSSAQLSELEEGTLAGLRPLGLIRGYGIGLLIDGLFALLLALILRKKDTSLDF
ncbi:MAG: DUF4199 domain-containing protein [Nitritalea sp.]